MLLNMDIASKRFATIAARICGKENERAVRNEQID